MNESQLPQRRARGKRLDAWVGGSSYDLSRKFGIVIGPTIEKATDKHCVSRNVRPHINRITLSGGLRQRREDAR